MALANYSDLRSSVANWLHRQDLTANIPDFIAMAEIRLSRDLRISPLLSSSSLTVSAAGSSVSLPTDFMEIVNLRIGPSGAELHYVPPDTLDRVTGGTVPWAYTLRSGVIEIAPAWTAGGSLSMYYMKKETPLSDTNATNWYITNAPDALLYASLLEASPYLMNDSRVDIWEKFYKRSVDALNTQYGATDPHRRMLAHAAGVAPASNLNVTSAGPNG